MMRDGSVAHILGRLQIVEARVSAAVERRRAQDPDPDDRFRGLYISDAQVDDLLRGLLDPVGGPDSESAEALRRLEAYADQLETDGEDLRLRRLARSFSLDALDVEILLVALAPDVDPRFERLYAYLHDDVSRRRPSTGLALELCGEIREPGHGRRRFGAGGPLIEGGLLLVEEGDRPFLTRSLRVPDRVAAFLFGDDTPDPVVATLSSDVAEAEVGDVAVVERALRLGARLVYLHERTGAAATAMAAAALRRLDRPVLALDLQRLSKAEDVTEIALAAIRESRLLGAALIAGPIEVLTETGPNSLRAFAEGACTMILFGSKSWDPAWSRQVPLIVEAAVPTVEQRRVFWAESLDGHSADSLEAVVATSQFRLTPEQVARAARAAIQDAEARGVQPSAEHVLAGARSQNAGGLERLARRIEPQVDWSDLVLPGGIVDQLHQLTDRARYREIVLDGWRMGRKSSKGRGITALFAGDSGTGKTMSAEVVAGDLGLDLYIIDLSTVVDKYIGETEKNLDRIFSEADRVNGVLLFDEADAIFGKRSEVKDSHDRYANVEVAYLLQRMELFDGVALLTTNLRANVDEAFTRRLDAIVDFPIPDEPDRYRLWEANLRADVPKSDDIDLDFLARAFKLSGGNVRNICVAAAYLSASSGAPLGMTELIRATESEYRKLGRLCVEAEFGQYFEVLTGARTS